jgi:hypothetical protein
VLYTDYLTVTKNRTLDFSRVLQCGKQDLKSEAAVNNASFCIIWYKVGIESDKIDQYHTL